MAVVSREPPREHHGVGVAEPIVYIDCSEIREGKVGALKTLIAELVEFVHAHEPQLISYGMYLDESTGCMRVVAIHPDSASLEFHMKIGGPEFRKFTELLELRTIDVYGRPSDVVLDLLREKAAMLGGDARVAVHALHAGFGRFGFARS